MREIHRDIVGGFVFSADDLLLLGHNYEGGVYSDSWVVPGGGINDGETKRNAIAREIDEETGLDVEQAELTEANDVHTGSHEKVLRNTGEKVLVHMAFYDFVIRFPMPAGDIDVRAEDDWGDVHWFNREELSGLQLAPPTAFRLQKLGYVSVNS